MSWTTDSNSVQKSSCAPCALPGVRTMWLNLLTSSLHYFIRYDLGNPSHNIVSSWYAASPIQNLSKMKRIFLTFCLSSSDSSLYARFSFGLYEKVCCVPYSSTKLTSSMSNPNVFENHNAFSVWVFNSHSFRRCCRSHTPEILFPPFSKLRFWPSFST